MQVVYPEQGFPEIFIITNLGKRWKHKKIKGTSRRRYECEHEALAARRRAARRWRLFDAYLWQTGVQTDLIPVLAASSRHTRDSGAAMCMCMCVICPHVQLYCSHLPLFPLHQIFITFPLR